jgi:hypothetical protein
VSIASSEFMIVNRGRMHPYLPMTVKASQAWEQYRTCLQVA